MDIKVDLTPVLVVSVVFLTSAAIVAIVFWYLHRAKELKHQTILLALEKGLPLPPGFIDGGAQPTPQGNDLNTGVKAVFIGIGIGLFFLSIQPRLWTIGLIPAFVGLGYIAAHALTGRKQPGATAAQ